MEEERRLCYVAMTRAKEKLYMTCASQRMLFGRTNSNRPSRFWGDPAGICGEVGPPALRRAGRAGGRAPRPPPAVAPHLRPGLLHGLRRRPGLCRRARPRLEEPAAGRAPAGGALPGFKMGTASSTRPSAGASSPKSPPWGRALVEIAFDSVGTKKLMLKSASQYMKKV